MHKISFPIPEITIYICGDNLQFTYATCATINNLQIFQIKQQFCFSPGAMMAIILFENSVYGI